VKNFMLRPAEGKSAQIGSGKISSMARRWRDYGGGIQADKDYPLTALPS
jgi:hypothetical protein